MNIRSFLSRFGRGLLPLLLLLGGAGPGRVNMLTGHAAGAGTVVAWGQNGFGQTNVPAGLSGVIAVEAGDYHSVALRRDGTVVAWGYNGAGQTTGTPNRISPYRETADPVVLDGVVLRDVAAVVAGYGHSAAMKRDGTVVAWGADDFGQATVPVGLGEVTAIAAGYEHTVALKRDGSVVAWGGNSSKQSTVPAGLGGVIAIAAGNSHTVALKHDGTVSAWGNNSYKQTTVPTGLDGVVAVAAGSSHTVALKSDGTVVAWGRNSEGQTDVPAGLSGVKAIAAGGIHSVALKSDGTVVAWGHDGFGQATVPIGLSGVTAIAAGLSHTMAVVGAGDGQLDTTFGASSGANGVVSASLTQPDGKVVVAGNFTTLSGQPSSGVVRFDRDGTFDAGFIQVRPDTTTGAPHVLALQPDGKLLVGGSLTRFNGTNCDRLIRLNADGTVDPTFGVSSCDGDIDAIAVQSDGKIVVGGKFTRIGTSAGPEARALCARLLPDGSLDRSFRSTGTLSEVLTVAVDATGRVLTGGKFSAASGPAGRRPVERLMPDGSLDKSFVPGTGPDESVRALALEPDGRTIMVVGGSTEKGAASAPRLARLREDGSADPGFKPVTDVGGSAAFEIHAVLRLPGGGYAIGGGFQKIDGQARWKVARLRPDGTTDPVFDTGTGSDDTCAGAVATLALDARGDLIAGGFFCDLDGHPWRNLARLHNTLPPHVVDPGFAPMLKPYATTVLAWGLNDSGQTNVPAGLGEVTAIAAGVGHSVALKSDGTVVAWGGNDFARQAVVPAGLSGVTAIAAGSDHTLVLKSDGGVVAWGRNDSFQTIIPDGLSGVTSIAVCYQHNVAIKSDGTVVAWGKNDRGQTSVPAGLSGVRAIAAGIQHTVALKGDGTVVAWGSSDYGQTTAPADLGEVKAIAAGYFHTVALKSDGTVVAWGRGLEGQTTVPAGLREVTAIGGGVYYTTALKSDGTVVTWGRNDFDPMTVPAGLSGMTAIAAGRNHILALKASGSRITAIVAEPDGGVVAGGSFPTGATGALKPSLRRIRSDGSMDPAFRPVSDRPVHRMARQPDGRLLVSSFEKDAEGFTHPDLVRLNPDGSRDFSFAPFAFPDLREPLGRFRVADDGRIYVLTPGGINAEPYSTRLRRLRPDGSVDRSFAVPPVSAGGASIEERIHDFALQTNGAVVVVGGFTQLQSRSRSGVARLNADGSFDSSFGDPKVTGGEVRLVALQPDGKVVIAGGFNAVNGLARPGLARLNPNGTHDTGFNPVVVGTVTSLSLEPDGRILLGGAITAGDRRCVVRLYPDGSLDATFGPGSGPDLPPGDTGFLEVVRASDGAHFVAGAFDRYDGQPRPALVRLLRDPEETRIAAGFAVDSLEVAETDTSASVVVRRTGDLAGLLTLRYAVTSGSATSGTDFAATTNTLTFAAGEAEKTFTVTLKDDDLPEGDEVVDLRLSAPDGTPLSGRDHIWLTLRDDERPAGSVDRTFVPPEGGPSLGQGPGNVHFVSALTDGGVLAAGYFNGYGDLADLGNLVRFRSDGSLDEEWSARARTDRLLDRPPVVQRDGRILLAVGAATVDGQSRRVLARLNADGTLDESFARLTSTLPDPLPNQIALQTNGSIWVVGPLGNVGDGKRTARLTGEGVLRLLPDGQLDPGFTPFSVSSGRILGVAPAPGGGAYIAGNFDLLADGGGRRMARLKADGALDTTFKPEVRFDTFVDKVLVQQDGRVLIAGNFYGIGAGDNPVPVSTLARLLPDGAVDPAFRCNSTRIFDWLRLLVDGKILAGGQRMHVGGAFRSGLVRLDPDGTVDLTFKPDLALTEAFDASLYGGDVDSQGRVLVAGKLLGADGEPRLGIARLSGGAAATPDAPPQVALTVAAPADGAGFRYDEAIGLTATASDDQGVARIEFLVDRVSPVVGSLKPGTTDQFIASVGPLPAGNHTLSAVATDTKGATNRSSEVTITVLPRPSVKSFSFVTAFVSSSESAGLARIKVRKTGDTGGTVSFRTVADAADTAKAGRDYRPVAGTSLVFQAGDTEQEAVVVLFDNRQADGTRTFRVRLADPGAGFELGETPEATVEIRDDDPATIATGSVTNQALPASATGGVQVNILDPPVGGRWRFEWERAWRPSGGRAERLPSGTFTVVFQPLPGFGEPTNLPVTVAAAGIQPLTYRHPAGPGRTGQLEVAILRSVRQEGGPAGVPGATWLLDGEGPVHADGDRMEVPAGTHLVVFQEAPGWTTPEPLPVTVVPGQRALVTGIYAPRDCPPAGVRRPEPLTVNDLLAPDETRPTYPLNGQIVSAAGRGSGVTVLQGVVLTAAHVVFDTGTLAFAEDVRWHRARMRPGLEPPPLAARGIQVLAGYAAQRSAELTDGAPVASDRLDAAALWFLGDDAARGGHAGFLASAKAASEWLDSLHETALIGYPTEGCEVSPGVMHEVSQRKRAYVPVDARIHTTADYRSFPGNSGGAVYARLTAAEDPAQRWFPAGIYLGPAADGASRVRVIDADVVGLINLAASYAGGGTNFSSGGVVVLQTGAAAIRQRQKLTVKLGPPAAVAAGARWQVPGTAAGFTNGPGPVSLVPGPYTVRFAPADGFLTPPDAVVQIVAGQDTALDVTYEPATTANPVLSITLESGLRVSGPVGATARLQFRAGLGAGDWADVPGRTSTLGTAPVTVLTRAEGEARPGFYRVVVGP